MNHQGRFQYFYKEGKAIFTITYPTNTSVTISALKHRVSAEISKKRSESKVQTVYILFEMFARLVISIGVSYVLYMILFNINGTRMGWFIAASLVCFAFLTFMFLWIIPFLSDASPLYRMESLLKVWKKLSYIELSLRSLDTANFNEDDSVLIKPYEDAGFILRLQDGKEYPVFLPYKAEILSETDGKIMLDLRIYDDYAAKVNNFLDNSAEKVFDAV